MHLQLEPMDLYLEETFVDELRAFITTLPLTTLKRGSSTPASTAQQAADVLQLLVETACRSTTMTDPKDLFGKWCASMACYVVHFVIASDCT